MAHPTGESESGAIRLDFDRRLMVQFRGSVVVPMKSGGTKRVGESRTPPRGPHCFKRLALTPRHRYRSRSLQCESGQHDSP
jgi:hypothetical protein